ncbi:MAG: nicotinate-nucleotide adenylyltransferase [Candidatus Melainabacteria bacterium]|nr:nicotinate-nucleotide adenylyltransferase [Candidatus Melainabacteria bacterium]
MGKSVKLGLLGGSFDPIHRAHIVIAKQAQERLGLDQVHFIVAKEAPHKPLVLDADKRYELVAKALEEETTLVPSDIELKREGVSYSYLTVEDYKAKYPEAELVWILGEDAFAELEGWKYYDYLAANLEFYVVPREINISSTQVREAEDVKELVPESIAQLVEEYYQGTSVIARSGTTKQSSC